MRTTVDLPDDLIDQAREAGGFTSKTDTVVFALRELIRRKRITELKSLMRRIEFDFDPRAPRRRERRQAVRRASQQAR